MTRISQHFGDLKIERLNKGYYWPYYVVFLVMTPNSNTFSLLNEMIGLYKTFILFKLTLGQNFGPPLAPGGSLSTAPEKLCPNRAPWSVEIWENIKFFDENIGGISLIPGISVPRLS